MSQTTRSLQSLPSAERLSWNQICERYPDQWVVVVDIDDDPGAADFTSAVVFAHGDKRAQISPSVKSAHQQFASVGTFWTGENRLPKWTWRYAQ